MKKQMYKVLAWLLLICCCMGQQESVQAGESKVVRVGFFEMEGFHSYNEKGELEGYCVDYLNIIAGLTGWQYEYVEMADFMECCDRLEAGEVDLVGPAMMSDSRKARFAYSEIGFGTEYTVLVTSQDRDDLHYEDYANFEKMKVAVLNDYPLTEYFINYMKTNGFTSELVYFDTAEESKQAMKEGKVDAMVDSILNIDEEQKLLAKFSAQPFYFLTYKENTQFLGELNKAMEQVQNSYPSMLNDILINYYPVYEEQFYTKEELEYIEQADVLKVAYVPDRRPLSFKNAKGELEGISRAIFDRISEISGLKFEYVQLPKGEITYEYLVEQGFDLLTGVEYNSANMSSSYIFMSRPYISSRKVIVAHSDFEYDENESYTLAVSTGSKTVKDVIHDIYPNFQILDYSSTQSCFEALYTGDIDMLMQNQYVVDAMLAKPICSMMKMVPMDGLKDELCFATFSDSGDDAAKLEKESRTLISIINKAIAQISDTEMDNMIVAESAENKYELDVFDFIYLYRYPLIILAGFVTLGIVLSFFYFRQRRKNDALLREEAKRTEMQKRRYETIIECSDDLIYEISLIGGASMGSHKIKKKFGWEIPQEIGKLDLAKALEILHVHPEDAGVFKTAAPPAGSGKFDEKLIRIGKTNGEYI